MKNFSFIVLRNSAFGLVSQLLIKVLSFTFSVFIVRQLGAQTYGQYSAILAFGMTFAFLSDLGLSPYLVREVARLRTKPDGIEQIQKLYSNVMTLRILLSLLTAVLIVVTAWLTGRPWVMIVGLLLNSIGLVLYGVHGSADSMLAGYERLDISSGCKIIYQVVFVVLGAGVLIFHTGYYGLILVNVLGIGLMTFVTWKAASGLGLRMTRPDPRIWKKVLRASLPFGILALALGLSYKFDSVLLNVTRGDTETGYYNAAYNLVFSFVMISNVVNTSLYPSLSRQSVSDPNSLGRIYERVFRYLALVSFPIAVGIWATAGKLISFLYTSEYQPSIIALQIVIWAVPFMFISEFLGYIVTIDNKERLVARSVVISTIVNVIANLILIPRFGYIAAAVMTVVTEIILVGQYLWILRKQLRAIKWMPGFFRPMMATATMGLIVVLLSPYLPLIALVAAGALAYLFFAFLFGAIRKEDIEFFKLARSHPRTASS